MSLLAVKRVSRHAQKLPVASQWKDVVVTRWQAGRGGDGIVHFGREPFKPTAPPDGGDGGRGGHIWLEIVPYRTGQDLRSIEQSYRALHGGRGGSGYAKGKRGEDTVIQIPKGTILEELSLTQVNWNKSTRETNLDEVEGGEEMEANDPVEAPKEKGLKTRRGRGNYFKEIKGQLMLDTGDPRIPVGLKLLVCKGGSGGKGNSHFLTSINRSPVECTEGELGQLRRFRLVLPLQADVGLIGWPNAGKSSLIQSISRCRSPVGHWACTTLRPWMATIQFPAQWVLNKDGYPMPLDGCQPAIVDSSPPDLLIAKNASKSLLPPFQMTVADLPGILRRHDPTLGRHLQRCKLWVWMLDVSQGNPTTTLRELMETVNQLETGSSFADRPALILANKADKWHQKCTKNGTTIGQEIEELKRYVNSVWLQRNVEVVPISCLRKQNVGKALWLMRYGVEGPQLGESGQRAQEVDDLTWLHHLEGVHRIQLP